MRLTDMTLDTLQNSKLGKVISATIRTVPQIFYDMGGRVQLALDKEPAWVGSSRMAIEQWKYALRAVSAPTKGQLLFAAIRNRRWVEWSIYSAAYLLRMGYQPVIVYSGHKIQQLYGSGQKSFFAVAQSLPYFEWIDVDDYMDFDSKTDFDEFARQASHTVAAYDLEVEEFEPDQAPGEYEQVRLTAEQMLRKYAVASVRVLRQYPNRRFICPSGLIGESLAMYEAAQRLGHETVYVEGWALRPGHNIWNLNRPALEYDVEGWLRMLGEWTDDRDKDMSDYMAFREGHDIDRDSWLDNFHQVQRSSKDEPLPPLLKAFLDRSGPKVLLGTNVVGDSSTLRRQTIFRSQQQWMEETTAFFCQHPDWNLIIRAHPDEMWVKSRLRMATFARQFAGTASNIYVIGGEENINTYTLVDRVDLGLAWVSNIGLDMALRGKPVVMGAKPKYTELGVVHEPMTRAEYFDLIQRLIVEPVSPNANAIRRGKAYHYAVFKLLSLYSDDKKYQSANYRLGERYIRGDQHKFYRILAGELNNQGQSPNAGR